MSALATPILTNEPLPESNNSVPLFQQNEYDKSLQQKKQTYMEWDSLWNETEEHSVKKSVTRICRSTKKALKESLEPGKRTFDSSFRLSKKWVYDLSSQEAIKQTKENLSGCIKNSATDIAITHIKLSEKNSHHNENKNSLKISSTSDGSAIETSDVVCNDDPYFMTPMISLCTKISQSAKDEFFKTEPTNGKAKLFFEATHNTMPYNCVQITAWIGEEPEELSNSSKQSLENESVKSNNESEAKKATGWFSTFYGGK